MTSVEVFANIIDQFKYGGKHVKRAVWSGSSLFEKEAQTLTLKAPRKNAFENVVCRSRLLQIIA